MTATEKRLERKRLEAEQNPAIQSGSVTKDTALNADQRVTIAFRGTAYSRILDGGENRDSVLQRIFKALLDAEIAINASNTIRVHFNVAEEE